MKFKKFPDFSFYSKSVVKEITGSKMSSIKQRISKPYTGITNQCYKAKIIRKQRYNENLKKSKTHTPSLNYFQIYFTMCENVLHLMETSGSDACLAWLKKISS